MVGVNEQKRKKLRKSTKPGDTKESTSSNQCTVTNGINPGEKNLWHNNNNVKSTTATANDKKTLLCTEGFLFKVPDLFPIVSISKEKNL